MSFSLGCLGQSEPVAATRLDRLSGHPVTVVGSQERHDRGDFRRLAEASQRDLGLDCLYEFGISRKAAFASVRVNPGATAFAVIPRGPSSDASAWVRLLMAALAIE